MVSLALPRVDAYSPGGDSWEDVENTIVAATSIVILIHSDERHSPRVALRSRGNQFSDLTAT